MAYRFIDGSYLFINLLIFLSLVGLFCKACYNQMCIYNNHQYLRNNVLAASLTDLLVYSFSRSFSYFLCIFEYSNQGATKRTENLRQVKVCSWV